MTALPENMESKPAYMNQASVTAFSHQGSGAAEVDAGWTALPGQKASDIRMLTGMANVVTPTIQPMTLEDSIAAKNSQLMALVQQKERDNQPEQVHRFYYGIVQYCLRGAVLPAGCSTAIPRHTLTQLHHASAVYDNLAYQCGIWNRLAASGIRHTAMLIADRISTSHAQCLPCSMQWWHCSTRTPRLHYRHDADSLHAPVLEPTLRQVWLQYSAGCGGWQSGEGYDTSYPTPIWGVSDSMLECKIVKSPKRQLFMSSPSDQTHGTPGPAAGFLFTIFCCLPAGTAPDFKLPGFTCLLLRFCRANAPLQRGLLTWSGREAVSGTILSVLMPCGKSHQFA